MSLLLNKKRISYERNKFYSITDTYGYALRLPEEQVFATEQEAQDKLKEIQGNE